MLDVEQPAAVRVTVQHAAAHGLHIAAQPGQIARQAQHVHPQTLEGRTDRRIAGHEAGAGEGLMLPDPGLAALVLGEGVDLAHQQPAGAVRPQPQIGLVEHAGRVKLVSQVLMRCARRA